MSRNSGQLAGSSHSVLKDWVVCREQPQCVKRLGGLLGAASVRRKIGWFAGSSDSASKDWVVCWEQPQCVKRLGGLLGAASVR